MLTARKGSNPSWRWSSILHGQDLLLQGSRWIVGTGTNISPSLDHWLPTSPSSTPHPCRSLHPFHRQSLPSSIMAVGMHHVCALSSHRPRYITFFQFHFPSLQSRTLGFSIAPLTDYIPCPLVTDSPT
ncbi:hypothetical protein LINGRAPRIM_LOCUS60 [Linum grandiflorum]